MQDHNATNHRLTKLEIKASFNENLLVSSIRSSFASSSKSTRLYVKSNGFASGFPKQAAACSVGLALTCRRIIERPAGSGTKKL